MDPVASVATVRKPRVATAWLGGCSGCHMSLMDLDERLIELAPKMDLVFSPVVDTKVFPEDVDATLVEGAVANEENLELIKKIRARTKLLVSFGDCAVTGNVTALRNPLGDPAQILARVYVESPDRDGAIPNEAGIVPALLPKVLPVHQLIPVDVYLPGCPPPAQRIREAVETLLDGKPFGDRGDAIRFG